MTETIETIRQQIQDIKYLASGDWEAADSLEDSLLYSVLETIAAGAENPQELASEVLKIADANFP